MPDIPALPDIEITPEMIEAGVEVFCGYDSRFEGPEDVVVEIYEAIKAASLVGLRSLEEL